jgi:hypothetical protein
MSIIEETLSWMIVVFIVVIFGSFYIYKFHNHLHYSMPESMASSSMTIMLVITLLPVLYLLFKIIQKGIFWPAFFTSGYWFKRLCMFFSIVMIAIIDVFLVKYVIRTAGEVWKTCRLVANPLLNPGARSAYRNTYRRFKPVTFWWYRILFILLVIAYIFLMLFYLLTIAVISYFLGNILKLFKDD